MFPGRVRSRDLPNYEQVASRVSYSWSHVRREPGNWSPNACKRIP
jgi:hypothetical protein